MGGKNELSYKELCNKCDPKKLGFKDTSELDPLKDIIGQDRAVSAMEFGLKVKMRGYNLYVSGATGTGKTSYAQNYVKDIAQKGKVPGDWCYVYNFENNNQPIAISLPAGMGKVFQKDMAELVKALKQEIDKLFSSEDYETEKNNIVKDSQNKRNKILEKLNADAEKQGFKVKATHTGIYFMPIVDGKTLTEKEFNELDQELRLEIGEKSDRIQLETIEVIRRVKDIEKETEEKLAGWEDKIALFSVATHIHDVKEKYLDYEKIVNYLEKVQEDILENIEDFKEEEVDEKEPQSILPLLLKKNEGDPTDKYKVNLLVDNSETTGAPVIVDFNPTYYNLLGRVEYENELGTMTTDFTMIKGGLFHQANGGYLILQAIDILSNIQSWEALKRILKTKQIIIENMKEQMGLVALSTLKPEPIPADIKVIIVGSEMIYQVLYEVDEDFRKLFKIKVDFDSEMERTPSNTTKLAQFIASFCKKENALHFDKTAVAKIIDYASWLADDQKKLSTEFTNIVEILCEAHTWATIAESKLVLGEHVAKAISEKTYRSNRYDKKLLELLEDGTIMVDTEGEKIGQINGLTIINVGDYSFGKPSKITATTCIGKNGIVNIEREVEMSGSSHSKGVLILSGYIGQKFAQDVPLALSASLCFEQLYGGIDGDSASSAELYIILSSLADVPITQSLAVTGSVNQKGLIQPIGGATQKIEGFFELCKLRGLDGTHGVIVPHQNVKNLMLNDEILDAVKNKKFHIYAVKTIDEGIEILTGVKAGEKNAKGEYPAGTINYKVSAKLKQFANTAINFGKQPKKGKNESK